MHKGVFKPFREGSHIFKDVRDLFHSKLTNWELKFKNYRFWRAKQSTKCNYAPIKSEKVRELAFENSIIFNDNKKLINHIETIANTQSN